MRRSIEQRFAKRIADDGVSEASENASDVG